MTAEIKFVTTQTCIMKKHNSVIMICVISNSIGSKIWWVPLSKYSPFNPTTPLQFNFFKNKTTPNPNIFEGSVGAGISLSKTSKSNEPISSLPNDKPVQQPLHQEINKQPMQSTPNCNLSTRVHQTFLQTLKHRKRILSTEISLPSNDYTAL